MMLRRASALCAILLSSNSALATITVEILSIGFPAEGEQKYVYRGGAYAPVAVRLSLTEEGPRQVLLNLEQHDRDGDIAVVEKSVGLTPDLAGAPPPHWLYFIPNPVTKANGTALTLYVLDENRETIRVMYNGEVASRISPPDFPEILDDGSFLVLSVSNDAAGKIRKLSDFGNESNSEFAKPVRVAHISPDRLPDHWIGLEMVDAIAWDGADPTHLSAEQLAALLDWVRHGGRLLLAAGASEDKLAASELKFHLPVRFSGVRAQSALPGELVAATWGRQTESDEVEYPQRLQIAQCSLRDGAEALVQSPGGTQTYLARIQLGRGSITCLAMTLHDLFSIDESESGPSRPKDFLRRALMLRRGAGPAQVQRQGGFMGAIGEIELFDRLHGFTGFRPRATGYMVLAILFVLVYVLAATFGTWVVLGRRNLRKHSWTAFFLTALAASGIGVLSVQAFQGFGTELHQITLVDSTVNTYSASAQAYFGIKTSSFIQDVDLWLSPGRLESDSPQRSDLYLRPLSPKAGSFDPDLGFADTQRYQILPTRAALEDVPIRATLKQFEGFWKGTMDGQIAASISIRPNALAGEVPFGEGSTITSKLAHDLEHCFLFEVATDADESFVQGARRVIVHPVGLIRAGETVDLVQRMNRLAPGNLKYPQEYTLKHFHKQWINSLGSRLASLPSFGQTSFDSLVDWQCAVLLLTTFEEFEPDIDLNSFYQTHPELLQTNCRRLDLSTEIGSRRLLLVGFAAEQGPVALFSRRGDDDYAGLVPKQAVTVYRISIPIANQEQDGRR